MSSDPWLRVKEVLAAVLEERPEARAALLDALCGGDAELRGEVESLLRAEAGADTFLEKPLLLGISPTTVKREWATGRAWLFRAIHGDAAS